MHKAHEKNCTRYEWGAKHLSSHERGNSFPEMSMPTYKDISENTYSKTENIPDMCPS